MGISFDLSVEDLPDNIFDLVVGGNYHKVDPFTISRWDGISPLPRSWIINDIQIANNIVLVCGSYEAFFSEGDVDPDVAADAIYEGNTFRELTWRDGFFATCNFDYLEEPEAWHIVPCRAGPEFGPYVLGDPDDFTEGGLYSMCVDFRTISQDQGSLVTGDLSPIRGQFGGGFQGEIVYVTAVGYHRVSGMDLNNFQNAAPPPPMSQNNSYDPYHYSLFANQDYYPCIYTFAVTPFLDPTDPAELAKVRTYESQTTYAEAGLPVNFMLDYIYRLTGNDGETIDQLGRAVHLNGISDDSVFGSGNPQFLGEIDYINRIGRSYGVAVTPLEQYSYRCHTIGILNTPDSGLSWFDPYGRAIDQKIGYCPTSFRGQFPIMKPLEFAIGVPGTQVREGDTEFFNLWTPESVRNPDSYDVVVDQVRVHSDALLWRHGYIPRKFKSVFRTQPVGNKYTSDDPTFPDGEVAPADAARLGTLTIGGDCLIQDRDSRKRPVSGQAKSNAVTGLEYEPLLVHGMNGWSQILVNPQESNQNLAYGFFMGYTARNMSVAEDPSGGGQESSLDNASIEWVAPGLEVNPRDSGYTVLLGFQITDPEERAEVYAFNPALVNSQNFPQRFCQDFKVVGPYISAVDDPPIAKTATRWHNIASQPILQIGPDPSPPNGLSYFGNFKRYGQQTGNLGTPVGRSNILGGNTDTGTYALAYDYGSAYSDLNPVYNYRVFAPTDPETVNYDGLMLLKFSGQRTTNDGYTDSLTAGGPEEIKFGTDTKKTGPSPRYGTRLYHIPNDSMQYPNNVNFPAGGWEWLQNSSLSFNGFDITALNAGATQPQPTGLYESLDDLVDQLNDALDYQKSAGPPFSLNTPNGLGGITFYKTSDNKGVYSRVDNQFLDFDPTEYGGYLGIVDPTAGGVGAWNAADNYPYGNDLPGGALPYIYEWLGAGVGGSGEPGAVTVEPIEVLQNAGCFLEIGTQLDDVIPDAITDDSKRFFLSGDYDSDRDQWLLSVSNIGATPEDGKYYVIAATTDYSEYLDQTDNFPVNSGNALLLALNQKTFKLDGAAFSGTFTGPLNSFPLDDNPVHGVKPTNGDTLYGYKISGTTGRDVKVFLNYMLYDGLDSLIAVEVANLGLRVTPENVLWYKTNILNQNADEEVTLEEIQNWMAMQREQYEELLRNRKPVTRDQGSLPNVKDFVLDDESIEDLLPELTRLPPNPDSDPSDADILGNTLSGDIRSVDEKRRETDV